MSGVGLPTEWEALAHSARVRGAAELGRQSRTDVPAARALREWRAGGFTQRLLAAFACHGSRDPAALLALTADPSRMIARVAVSVLGDGGDSASGPQAGWRRPGGAPRHECWPFARRGDSVLPD